VTTVTTDHLILRPFTEADHADYAQVWAKPEVVRFLLGDKMLATEAAERARLHASEWEAAWRHGGIAPWAVVGKGSSRLLGHLGLQLLPELNEAELLFMLDSACWGLGYAVEGGIAALDYGFGTYGLDQVVGMAVPENTPSHRVFGKLGFAFDGERQVFGQTAVYYTLDQARWLRRF